MNFWCSIFYVLIHLCRIFSSKRLNCIGGIKAKASALQQHNSNACIGLHNAPIHTAAGAYIWAEGSSFRLGGGSESEGRRPEEIFKFRVSEMLFPGLWGRFDRILMVGKQRFSMSKFTI